MISKTVRDAVKAQLSATDTGLNDRLAALAAAYAVSFSDSVAPYTIDWSTTSGNFLFGRVNPAAIESSSVFSYPLLTIDTVRAANTNRVKFATFAGPVVATIDVHHSWPEQSVLADFASQVDLTEEAIVSCLNDQDSQAWPGNLLWNGIVSAQRGPIVMGGYGWMQSLQFVCQFELIV
jgi:hypothetical protein